MDNIPRIGFSNLEDFQHWIDTHVDSTTTPYEAYLIPKDNELILEPKRNKKERNYVLAHFNTPEMKEALSYIKSKSIAPITSVDFYDWRIDGIKVVTQD